MLLFLILAAATAWKDDGVDTWDFYFAKVDDKPASIFVNFAFEKSAPLADQPAMLWIAVKMKDPGPTGMGTEAERQSMAGVEDKLKESVKGTFVGRLRSAGEWQLFFYGKSSKGLAEAAKAALGQRP